MSRNNLTVDKVLADLEHDKLMARKVGQYAVAKECSIAQGKYLAMFTDNTNVTDTVEQQRLRLLEDAEAERIISIRLREMREEQG